MLEKLFQLQAHNTSVRTEMLAGLTTFLTMAYILFVNPAILGETGMDKGAVFVATCLAAAIGSAVMGLIANYPIALAPGMGLNAFFTYTVVLHMGHSWQVALGAVFISATLFFVLSVFRIREWIINSIPLPLRSAISAGIGLFLALIALKEAGLVIANPATLVGLGDLSSPGPLLAILGFFLIVALEARRVTGAVMIGILVVTAIAIALGVTPFGGIVSMPPSMAPTFLQLDIMGALDVGMISVIFAFLFVDLFDNTGTLIGVAQTRRADEQGRSPAENGPRPDRRQHRRHGRFAARHQHHYQLYRVGRRRGRGWAYRPDRLRGCRAVLAGAVFRPAGRHCASLCHRAGTAVRRGADDLGSGGNRLGRHHRRCAGGDHRPGHAADLLDRQRHRFRL